MTFKNIFIYDKLKSAERVCISLMGFTIAGIGTLIEYSRMMHALGNFFYNINPSIKIDIVIPNVIECMIKTINIKQLDRIFTHKTEKRHIAITTSKEMHRLNENTNTLEVLDFIKQSDIIIDIGIFMDILYKENVIAPLVHHSLEKNKLLFFSTYNQLVKMDFLKNFSDITIKVNNINDTYDDLIKPYCTNLDTVKAKIFNKYDSVSSFVQATIDRIPKDRKIVVILPTSVDYFRKYKLSHWQTIINALAKDDRYYFIVLGGSKYSYLSDFNKDEINFAKALLDGLNSKALQNITNLTSLLEYEESASIINNFANYCITNDTGLTHWSILCGVPTLILSSCIYDYQIARTRLSLSNIDKFYNMNDLYQYLGYKCSWLEILAGNPDIECRSCTLKIISRYLNSIFNFDTSDELREYLHSIPFYKGEVELELNHLLSKLTDDEKEYLLHSIPPERVIETFLTKIVPLKRLDS